MKVLIPSLILMDMQEMEEKCILSVEDIECHDKEILAPWTMSTVITKIQLMVLMNCIEKFGCGSDKSMNEIFRDSYAISKPSDDSNVETRVNTRKSKPKWSVKEVPQFDDNPKNWVNWIKTQRLSWVKQDVRA